MADGLDNTAALAPPAAAPSWLANATWSAPPPASAPPAPALPANVGADWLSHATWRDASPVAPPQSDDSDSPMAAAVSQMGGFRGIMPVAGPPQPPAAAPPMDAQQLATQLTARRLAALPNNAPVNEPLLIVRQTVGDVNQSMGAVDTSGATPQYFDPIATAYQAGLMDAAQRDPLYQTGAAIAQARVGTMAPGTIAPLGEAAQPPGAATVQGTLAGLQMPEQPIWQSNPYDEAALAYMQGFASATPIGGALHLIPTSNTPPTAGEQSVLAAAQDNPLFSGVGGLVGGLSSFGLTPEIRGGALLSSLSDKAAAGGLVGRGASFLGNAISHAPQAAVAGGVPMGSEAFAASREQGDPLMEQIAKGVGGGALGTAEFMAPVGVGANLAARAATGAGGFGAINTLNNVIAGQPAGQGLLSSLATGAVLGGVAGHSAPYGFEATHGAVVRNAGGRVVARGVGSTLSNASGITIRPPDQQAALSDLLQSSVAKQDLTERIAAAQTGGRLSAAQLNELAAQVSAEHGVSLDALLRAPQGPFAGGAAAADAALNAARQATPPVAPVATDQITMALKDAGYSDDEIAAHHAAFAADNAAAAEPPPQLALPPPAITVDASGNAATNAQLAAEAQRLESLGLTPDVQQAATAHAIRADNALDAERTSVPGIDQTLATLEGRTPAGASAPEPSEAQIDPDVEQRYFDDLVHEIGWDQEGGQALRDGGTNVGSADNPLGIGPDGGRSEGEVTGRTGRVPLARADGNGLSDFWSQRPVNARLTPDQARAALSKAAAGEPLKPIEQRFVDYAHQQAHDYAQEFADANAQHQQALQGQGDIARQQDTDALRNESAAFTGADSNDALTVAQWATRALDAGMTPEDVAQVAGGGTTGDKVARLALAIQQRGGTDGAQRLPVQLDRTGNRAAAPEGQGAELQQAGEGNSGASSVTQSELLPPATGGERLRAASAARDAERNGLNGGNADTGDGGLFDGDRPQQADLAGGSRFSRDAPVIPNFPNLTPREREVETRARNQVLADPQAMVDAYRKLPGTQGGRIISTDMARSLFGDFVASPSANAVAVHEPASWVANEVLRQRLTEPVRPGNQPLVLFTGGGTGSGKSRSLRLLAPETRNADIIYDGNLQSVPSAMRKLNAALASGRRVSVHYTLRDPVEALVHGALKRAMNPQSSDFGRTLRLGIHAATHLGSARAYGALRAAYAHDPRVSFGATLNKFNPDTGVSELRPATDDEITHAGSVKRATLLSRLQYGLEQEYANGRISEPIYAGFAEPHADRTGDVGARSGARNGPHDQALSGASGDRVASRGTVRQGVLTSEPGGPKAIRREAEGHAPGGRVEGNTGALVAGFKALAQNPSAFRNHLLPGKTASALARESDGITYTGVSAHRGIPAHEFLIRQNDGSNAKATLFDDGRNVWVNVSGLKPEGNAGDRFYNLAASYAINKGRNFVEDPEGLTDTAVQRRPVHQVSMMLKANSADNIGFDPNNPGFLETQRPGGPPTRPIRYDLQRRLDQTLLEHLLTLHSNTLKAVPEITHYAYDTDKGTVIDSRTGEAVGNERLKRLASDRRSNPVREMRVRVNDSPHGQRLAPAPVGWRTLKTAILAQTLLRAEPSEGARIVGWLGRQHGLGNADLEQLGLKDILPSRDEAPADAGVSASGERAAPPLTTDQVRATAAKAWGNRFITKLERAGHLEFLTSDELLARRDSAGKPIVNRGDLVGTKGVYHGADGNAYIVTDHIAPGQVAGTVLHEAGLHYGYDKLSTPEQRLQLRRKVNRALAAGDPEMVKAWRHAEQVGTPAKDLHEEAMAYLVENNPGNGIAQRVVDAFKRGLNRLGVPMDLLQSDSDAIRMMARDSLRASARGAETTQDRQALFSRDAAASVADSAGATREQLPHDTGTRTLERELENARNPISGNVDVNRVAQAEKRLAAHLANAPDRARVIDAAARADGVRFSGDRTDAEATPESDREATAGGVAPAPEATSIKNAQTAKERADRGLEALQATGRRSMPQVWATAERTLRDDPLAGERLAAQIASKPRALTPEEGVTLAQDRARLLVERRQAADAVNEAVAAGDDTAQANARWRMHEANSKLDINDEAARQSGYEQGLALSVRQAFATMEYGLDGMESRLQAAKGKPLDASELQQLKDLHTAMQAKEVELSGRETAQRHKQTETKGQLQQQLRLFNDQIKEAQSRRDTIRQKQLHKQIHELARRIAEGDYSKVKRDPIVYNAATNKLLAERNALRRKFDRMAAMAAYKNRSVAYRLVHTAINARLAIMLTSLHVFPKLILSAIYRIGLEPIEHGIQGAYSMIPGLRAIAGKAATTGFSLKAEGRALRDTFSAETVRQMWQIFRTGESDLDLVWGKSRENLHPWLAMVGQAHGALKYPAVRNAMSRGAELAAQHEVARARKAGMSEDAIAEHLQSPEVQSTIMASAYLESLRIQFKNQNVLNSAYSGLRRTLEQQAAKGIPGANALKLALEYNFPIVKVPTNIALETTHYMIGGVNAAMQLLAAHGVKNLTTEQADYIMRNLSKQTLGLAIMAIGYYSYKSMGGFYLTGDNKRKGLQKEGTIKTSWGVVPKFLLESPLFIAMQAGATMHRVDRGIRRKAGGGYIEGTRGPLNAAIAAGKGVGESIPFFDSEAGRILGDISKHPLQGVGHELASSYIQPDVRGLAKSMDHDRQRYPRGLMDEFKAAIPGLRQQVPRKPERRAHQ